MWEKKGFVCSLAETTIIYIHICICVKYGKPGNQTRDLDADYINSDFMLPINYQFALIIYANRIINRKYWNYFEKNTTCMKKS